MTRFMIFFQIQLFVFPIYHAILCSHSWKNQI